MTQDPTLATIRSRKEALLATAAKYDSLAAKARGEAADYEAAERVWLKLYPQQDGSSIAEQQHSTHEDAAKVAAAGHFAPTGLTVVGVGDAFLSTRGGPFVKVERPKNKPANIPPVPEMIVEELRDAGPEGKTAAEILELIQLTYWPEATSSDVGSTAWRMWKEGRLARPEQGRYALINSQIKKVSPPEPSATEQEVISG